MQVQQLRSLVLASLTAALIAIGGYIHIPLGPVPIVLQNFFVLLAALLLGGRWALAGVGIYLLLGAAGLPVFHGGRAGIGHLLGPTGGYLFGFAAAAYLTGAIAERFDGRLYGMIAAVVAGSLVIYLIGVPWLKFAASMEWNKAVMAGMVPFVFGDAVKAAAAVAVARSLRPMLDLAGRARAA